MLHHLFSLTLVAVLALLSSVSAENIPTLVNLRIEGSTKTIFEGSIFTTGHKVTTALGGTHICDGTNNDANTTPGPTCTSALDDASKSAKFPFNGPFFTQIDDFFITSIDGNAETSNEFWGILLNFKIIPLGGCQQEVKLNDEVLFAFDAFNKVHYLKLTGPRVAAVDTPVVLTVTDAQNGSPVAGAEVDGKISDANGHVEVTFVKLGANELKAEKSDSIRSNRLTIDVI